MLNSAGDLFGVDKKALRDGLNRTLAESLAIPVVLLAVLDTLLTPVFWFWKPVSAAALISLVSAVTAASWWALYWFGIRKEAVSPRSAHPLATFIVLVELANASLPLYYRQSPLDTTTFALLILGSASVVLSRPWWFSQVFIAWAFWLAGASLQQWSEEWTHYAIFLLTATFLGYIVLSLRIRVQQNLYVFRHHRLQIEREERLRAQREIKEKERALSTLISNLAGIVYRCKNDRNWTMEYLSEGTLTLTGYSSEEFRPGQAFSYADLIIPEDRETVWNQVQEALATRTPFQINYRIRRKDGEERWVLEQGRAVYAETGELEALEGYISDITDRKRAELELQRSEGRLRLALEGSEVGIWDLDVVNWHMEWTEGMAKLFGMPVTELSGSPAVFEKYLPADELKKVEAVAANALNNRGAYDVEYRALPAQGGERWIFARGHVFRDVNGKPLRLMGYVQDITARKTYEDQLREAKERAEEANRLKSAIFANMSHEIRTPMTAILGYSEILMRKLGGTTMVRDAEVINLGGKRLLKLLTNVLDLARLEAGKTKLQVTGHELGESLSRTVDLLRVLAVNKGLTLTLSIEPGLLVAGDLQAEEQIWNNLIGNAIKFTEKGGVTVEAYRQNELAAMVVIRDTGIGIGSAFLPHIFEEFRQESEGLGRQYEGTGLGLTITKRLVEALDGTISVASEEGHGTTVTVSLPLAIKESPPESMALTEAQPPVSPLPPPLKILAVEDDPSTSRLIVRVLKDIGHVTTCQTSEEVLATARAEKFDLILIDINLKGSGMNGLDVRRLLRALPGYRRTPMVAVTAYAMDGDEQRFLAGGFDGYLAKPFDANELKNLVLRVAQSLPETELR